MVEAEVEAELEDVAVSSASSWGSCAFGELGYRLGIAKVSLKSMRFCCRIRRVHYNLLVKLFLPFPLIFLSCSFLFLPFPFIFFPFLSFSFHFPFLFLSFSFLFLSFPFLFLSFSFPFLFFPFPFLSFLLRFSFRFHFLFSFPALCLPVSVLSCSFPLSLSFLSFFFRVSFRFLFLSFSFPFSFLFLFFSFHFVSFFSLPLPFPLFQPWAQVYHRCEHLTKSTLMKFKYHCYLLNSKRGIAIWKGPIANLVFLHFWKRMSSQYIYIY